MADLKRVKVSDVLIIPVKVLHVDDAYGAPVKVAFETVEFWLDRDTAQAAEHIPAPRIWKPRDAVRLRSGAFNDGIVVDIRSADKESLVYWPSGRLDWEKNGDLEPDEAPE